MAVGDAAGAKGLTVYDDSLLVKDVDTALNQRGDDIAKTMTRLDKVEAAAIGVPRFSVRKSNNGQNLVHDKAAVFTGGAWGRVIKNVGGYTWSGGVLTVPRAGVYSVVASMKSAAEDYYATYIKVTRNTTDPDASGSAIVTQTVIYPGDRATNSSNKTAPTAQAIALLVNLNANDKLRVVGYQRNYGGQTKNLDDGETSLTFEVLWQDVL